MKNIGTFQVSNNLHVKPLLEGKEFYKLVDKMMISVIATQRGANDFEKSIIESAGKGYLTSNHIRTYLHGLELNKRLEIIKSTLKVLDITINPKYLCNMIQQWIGININPKDAYKELTKDMNEEERKQYNIEKEKQAMVMLNDLYVQEHDFQYIVDSRYPKGKITEYCLESGLFIKFENILENKVDKLYEVV